MAARSMPGRRFALSRRAMLRLSTQATLAAIPMGCAMTPAFEAGATLVDNLFTLAAREGICAAALAVLEGGKVREVAATHSCPDPLATPLQETVFQAASLGKPLFAYAVLKHIAAGHFDLDQPLLPLLPDGYVHVQHPWRARGRTSPVQDPRLARVNARMVLSHTSGLPNWSAGPLAFEHEPGARWQYSGEGFMLLQRVIEHLESAPLHVWTRRFFFESLGMHRSSFLHDEHTLAREVGGEVATSTARFERPVAAASLLTTAGDYARFVAALLSDEARLSVTLRTPVDVAPSLGIRWGLGWGLHDGNGGRHIWHWGNNPGFRSFVIASPDSGDGFVLLTNHRRGLMAARRVVDALHPSASRVFDFSMLR